MTVGANNIFNNHPDKIANTADNPIYVLTGSTSDGQVYPRLGGPFGINGGFWYVRLAAHFAPFDRLGAAAPMALPPPPPPATTDLPGRNGGCCWRGLPGVVATAASAAAAAGPDRKGRTRLEGSRV